MRMKRNLRRLRWVYRIAGLFAILLFGVKLTVINWRVVIYIALGIYILVILERDRRENGAH